MLYEPCFAKQETLCDTSHILTNMRFDDIKNTFWKIESLMLYEPCFGKQEVWCTTSRVLTTMRFDVVRALF